MNQPTPADSSTPIYRILDANANRAGEGLRTIEETVRFIWADTSHAAELKSLRHRLAIACERLSRERLLAARNTGADVGTRLSEPTEQERASHGEVVAAAAVRTQQALRCLEEYGKQIDIEFASQIEAIRYRAYDVLASVELAAIETAKQMQRNQRHGILDSARLYALIDAGDSDTSIVDRVGKLAAIGVAIIQIRDHSIDDRTLFERSRAGAIAAKRNGVLFIVNDRPDIAVASDADGVHVGQEELPVGQVRKIVGRDRIIGLSTHNLDQVVCASESVADYIGCGPVFPGLTKSFDAFPGCEFLKQTADHFAEHNHLAMPAFAIGGIDRERIPKVAEAGFGRIAVTAALAGERLTHQNATQLLTSLKTVPLSAVSKRNVDGDVAS